MSKLDIDLDGLAMRRGYWCDWLHKLHCHLAPLRDKGGRLCIQGRRVTDAWEMFAGLEEIGRAHV